MNGDTPNDGIINQGDNTEDLAFVDLGLSQNTTEQNTNFNNGSFKIACGQGQSKDSDLMFLTQKYSSLYFEGGQKINIDKSLSADIIAEYNYEKMGMTVKFTQISNLGYYAYWRCPTSQRQLDQNDNSIDISIINDIFNTGNSSVVISFSEDMVNNNINIGKSYSFTKVEFCNVTTNPEIKAYICESN